MNVVPGVRRRNNGHVCVVVPVGTELAKQTSSAREPEESVGVQPLAGRLSRATVFLGFWSVKWSCRACGELRFGTRHGEGVELEESEQREEPDPRQGACTGG